MNVQTIGIGTTVVVGGLFMGGAFEAGETYARPYDQVYEEVASMKVPAEFRQMVNDTPGGQIRKSRGDGEVRWRITVQGHELAQFTAEVRPESETETRVIAHFETGDDIPDGQLRKLQESELIGDVAEIVFLEQLDSSIEERPFDEDRVASQILGYALRNPGAIAEYQQMLQGFEHWEPNAEEIAAYERLAGEVPHQVRVQNARVREGSTQPMVRPSSRAYTRQATRPMTDLSDY